MQTRSERLADFTRSAPVLRRGAFVPASVCVWFLALGAAALFLPSLSAGAPDPPPRMTAAPQTGEEMELLASTIGWEESAGLRVVSGDSLDAGARIFDSPDYQQTLVVPGSGDSAFLLALKKQGLKVLPMTALKWDAEGLPIPDPSLGVDEAGFISDDGVISFTIGETEYKVEPEPPLVGPLTLEMLEKTKPDYVVAAERFTPDPAAIEALKKVSADTRIVVFFGTWCSYCKHWLPSFLKVVQETGNPHFEVDFFGVSEDQSEPAEALKNYAVTLTPTFVVSQQGKEIGRIEEEPEVSIEGDLVRILKAH